MTHFDTGLILTLITIAGTLVTVARWFHHRFKDMEDLLDDWRGEEARPGVPRRPGVMERLDSIECKVNSAAFNSRPNHGTSAYDQHTEMLSEILRMVRKENQ